MSEKKATLIKHVKSSNTDAEPTTPVEAASTQTQPKIEKKKIIVKKKVVRIKPQPKAKEGGSSLGTKGANKPIKSITETSKATKEHETKKRIIKKTNIGKGSSPLHTGPVIIKSTNLPPVPNQGKTAKDHAEWQSKNAGKVVQPNPNPAAPRVAGTVGGKPVAGSRNRNTRNPRQNNYNRNNQNGGGYNNNNTQGGYNRNNNQGGYNRPNGGYNNNQGGYNRNNNQAGGYNRPNGGYNRNNNTGGNRAPGGYNRPNNGGGFNRNNNGGFNRNNSGGGNSPAPNTFGNGKSQKKTFKKKNNSYQKRDATMEKEFQIQRKREQAAAKLASVPKSIDIMESITVADLAKKMNLKANDIIAKLFTMGMMVTINQQIDHETAEIIASEYNCKVKLVSLYDETLIESEKDNDSDLVERAPIVTIMGHVDHGKTKLLDAIRSTNVAGGEFGGITQHIGAYKVGLGQRGDIVFLDTPGHAAFTMMRSRGAQITDIVVLVVAANDGVMPQTREAIDHAKAAKVPIIVAINKCDLPESNPDRVMQQLSDLGLMPEEWGGQTLYCKISALKKEGIDELLDTILLESEILELKANPNCRAEGKIIESRIDQGRGTVASVLIERGTLRQGDHYVAGIYPGRVRAMFDDTGKKIKEAGPSTPVEIIGLSNIPSAGDPFQVTEDEKQARQVGAKRQELERMGANKTGNKFTLDTLFDKVQEGTIESFNVIIKGDVQGSVEALQTSLEKLSTSEIRLNVIRSSAGAIIESDITLASASAALVIGFNVRPTPRALALAEQEKVEIRKYNIIYDVVDDVRDAMEGMLSPIVKEVEIGTVEVRDTFKVPKIGLIAGCYVLTGKVKRNSLVRVIRDNIQVSKSLIKLSSLKRFKDDAKEVAAGFECGMGLENFQDLRVGDILEIIEEEKVARKLEDGVKNESV
ncbi:MAG: translation initiation factor IF-2 [Sphaerochaetaceae bacterium]|nr:translation initiation factor IF-2 [Sphaerochaetaceae bacterium]MDC7236547.1 translation initiation factor IF-2 [Sphaerochaetaceae bacterium]MDC7244261.1 translation initiation factor IF-2 [Sphaerochaetaceae bacterium]MDC7250765.1 translation initiation factor IF-2 [Sphaerochaetaceae bacterium]